MDRVGLEFLLVFRVQVFIPLDDVHELALISCHDAILVATLNLSCTYVVACYEGVLGSGWLGNLCRKVVSMPAKQRRLEKIETFAPLFVNRPIARNRSLCRLDQQVGTMSIRGKNVVACVSLAGKAPT